jgi:hypothetical protein
MSFTIDERPTKMKRIAIFCALALASSLSFAQTYRSIGDSIANEYGVPASSGWRYKLAADIGQPIAQLAVNGAQTADLAGPMDAPGQIYSQTIAANDVAFVRIGTNDARIYGLDAGKREYTKRGLRAAYNWLTRSMTKATNSAVTYSGTWSSTYAFSMGMKSNVAGATASFNVTGSSVVLNMIQQDVSTGVFSVTIDGVNKGSFSLAAPGMQSQNGATFGPAGFIFTGLSAGSHAVVITVVSGGWVYFDAFGGDAVAKVYATDLATPETGTSYSGGSTVPSVYNADRMAVAADYGASVVTVAVSTLMTSTDMIDFHERASAQDKAYLAFKGALTGIVPPATGAAKVYWRGSKYFISRMDDTGEMEITP